MNTQDFDFWLNGFVELNGQKPNDEQWESIKEHLGLVFKKETRIRGIYPGGNILPLRDYDENAPISLYGRDVTC